MGCSDLTGDAACGVYLYGLALSALHALFLHRPARRSLLISPYSGNTERALQNSMKDLLPVGCQLQETIAGLKFKYLSEHNGLAVT